MKIKRARGHRLYTTTGEKILDLSMDRSRAVIGHRPNGLSLTIKNTVDRGIYASYDSIYSDRILKFLKSRFPEYPFVTILNYEDKIKSFFNCEILDPLFSDCENSKISYWRPFLDTPNSDNLVLLYPLPGLNTVSILISKEENNLESDIISPVLLSGILRSFYDYDIAFKKFNINDYAIYKNINNSILKAPYLILKIEMDEYKKLYENGLKSDILLNEKEPIIVLANDFSKGEIDKIISFLN